MQLASPLFGPCDVEQIALSKPISDILTHRYLFLFIIKIFPCCVIWNSFRRFLWATAGKFLEVPHLFIFCQWQALFMLRHFILFTVISESISFDGESIYHSAHSHFSFSSFLSLWHSVKFIRAFFSFFLSFPSWTMKSRKTQKAHCLGRIIPPVFTWTPSFT